MALIDDDMQTLSRLEELEGFFDAEMSELQTLPRQDGLATDPGPESESMYIPTSPRSDSSAVGGDEHEKELPPVFDAQSVESLFQEELGTTELESLFQEELESTPTKAALPQGIRWGSRAFFQALSEKRWPNVAQPSSVAEDKLAALGDAWKLLARRVGDQVQVDNERPEDGSKTWTHANTLDFTAWIRGAFCELGKGTATLAGENSFDGTRRGLEGLVNVAAVTTKAFARKVGEYYQSLKTRIAGGLPQKVSSVVMGRYFDASPVLLRLGRLRSHLEKQTRYLKLVEPEQPHGYSRWRLVSFDEWRRDNPRATAPGIGVLEVFAKTADVTVGGPKPFPSAEGFWMESQEFVYAPQLCESTTASCTHGALERGMDPFNLSGLQHLAEDLHKEGGVLLLHDAPDNCKANKRLKRAISTKLASSPNILYPDSTGCEGHIIHNIITQTMKEDEVVGHIHAYQSVVAVQARREALQKAAHEIIKDEIDHQSGVAPAEDVEHLEDVINATLRRRRKTVSSYAPEMGADSGDEDLAINKAVEKAIPLLKTFANGKISRPRVQHLCNGCCQDSDGCTSTEVCVENTFTAISSTGIFGGIVNDQPAKSRWLTASHVLCLIVLGTLLFRILPRAWCLAFAAWHIPEGLIDDHSKMVRSKAYRVKLWFMSDTMPCLTALYCIICGPAEHMLQTLQSLDARGGLLRDIAGCKSNIFFICRQSYAEMLRSPLTTALRVVIQHFKDDGPDVVSAIFQQACSKIFMLDGLIWKELHAKYLGWPFRLVLLVMDRGNREAISKSVHDSNLCCLDSMTKKVRYLSTGWKGLLRHRGLMIAITIWSFVARLCNMATERLLSLIRKAAFSRCCAERLLAAGLLTQILKKHLAAGGRDIRKVTRSLLLQMNVPIKVAGRSAKEKQRRRPQCSFAKWCNRKQLEYRDSLGLAHRGRQPRLGDRETYRKRMVAWRREYAGLSSLDNLETSDSDPEQPVLSYSDRVGSKLFSLSSPETPLLVAPLQAEIDAALPSHAQRTGGLTDRLQPIRDSFGKEHIIKEENLLPSSEKYEVWKPCGELHPGVCRRQLTPELKAVCSELQKSCGSLESGCLLGLYVNEDGDNPKLLCYKLAHSQDNQEPHIILAACNHGGDSFELRLDDDGLISEAMGEAVLVDIWASYSGGPDSIDLKIFEQPEATTLDDALSLLPAYIPPVHKSRPLWPIPADALAAEEEALVQPPMKGFIALMKKTIWGFEHGVEKTHGDEKPVKGKKQQKHWPDDDGAEDEAVVGALEAKLGDILAKARERGMKDRIRSGKTFKSTKRKLSKTPCAKKKLRCKPPAADVPVAPAAGASEMDTGALAAGASEICPGAPAAVASEIVPEAHAAGEGEIGAEAPAAHDARIRRGWAWGRRKWRLAVLKSGGMGATCGYHSNQMLNRAECQKTCNLTSMTMDEKRVRLKLWLLKGLDIPDNQDLGQVDHVHNINLKDLPLEPEDEVDLRMHRLCDGLDE